MEQDNTSTPVSNAPTGKLTSNTPPVGQTSNIPTTTISNTSSSTPTPTTTSNKWVRSILFFLFFFLILLFYSNIFIAAILATLFNLLSVSVFDNIASVAFDYCEKFIKIIFTPLIWISKYLFERHLVPLSTWFTSLRGGWFARHSQFVTIMVTLTITVLMLASTILHPVFAAGSGNINDYFCLKTQFPWPTCASGLGITTLPDDVRIGLIENNTYGPFDQSTYNQDEKNVEELIFQENQHACTGQHITLILVTMLSRTVEDPQSSATIGIQNLQGNYLAQQSYNATHPALPLCFAIANLGTADTSDATSSVVSTCPACYSMPQAVHQIAQFAHSDGSVRGIVGFPYSQQVKEALQIIKDSEQSLSSLPIISPSASSDNFSNIPNFYRANSPDQNQAAAIAQYFCSHLVQNQPSPSVAILADPTNYYSGDLAIDFQNDVNCLSPTNQFGPIHYKNYDSASIQNAVDVAVQQDHATYIFFPGYDQDMDTVEEEVYKDVLSSASSVTIIGGDGLNNVNATTHYSYSRVYAVNFAQPLSKTEPLAQNFINDGFAKAHTTPTPTIDPADLWMPTDAFLDFDAVQAMTKTVQAQAGTNFTQSNFNTTLQSISFQGETGNITFQGYRLNSSHMSDRTQQSVYITCYDTKHILHLVDSYLATTDNSTVQEDSSIPNITSCA